MAWPVLAVVLAGLIPNLFTAPFNFLYNYTRMQSLSDATLARFNSVQLWINAIAFSVGVSIGAWKAITTLRMLRDQQSHRIRTGVRRMLSFSRFVSGMLLALWTLSGIAFPVAIVWGQGEAAGFGFHLHFFTSLAVCGSASTAYPYFLITFLSVHYFVPALMRNGVVAGPEKADVDKVRRFNRFHLTLAALVPMLGGVLLVLFGDYREQGAFGDRVWATIALVAGGLGYWAMGRLEQRIEQDLAALEVATE